MITKYMPLMLAALLLVSCSSQQKFTAGKYNNPNETRLLDDKFNEADMKQLTEVMITSLLNCYKVPKNYPTVVMGEIRNQTLEHINLEAVTDRIQTALVKSDRFVFLDKPLRSDVNDEAEYQTQQVRPNERVPQARQMGAKYMIAGRLSSNVQEVGEDKLVYYKLNLNLTDLASSAILCSEEKDVRKEFKRKDVD